MNIVTASYLAAAVVYAFLGLFFLIGWRGQYRGALLAVACLVTSFWGGANAYAGYTNRFTWFVEATDILRSVSWLAFVWVVWSRAGEAGGNLRLFKYGLIATSLSLLALAYSGNRAGFLGDIMGHVALAVGGIVLVEQLYRNTHSDSRWSIKFMCMAVGAMFAYDFFLYSEAMLFRHIDMDLWTARGVVNAMVAPLIIVSAARNPQWSLKVHMSRHVVFHSASLFGAGFYLLVMAAAGYYIRIFGGKWGSVLQVAFLFGASIVLLTIFFSGSIRSKLRVFLSKHFFSYKYDYREEWLRFTRTLTLSQPAEIFDSAIKAIAALVESPAGALWMRDERHAYACVARWNIPMPSVTVSEQDSMANFMVKSQWVINLEEYARNRELYGDLEIPSWLVETERAWLVVPLILSEKLLGFIVLTQPRSAFHFNWEVSDLLKAAGHQLANSLAQKQATDELLVAKQFDSFNRMSAFVVHDLKNLVAQLSLLLSNAERHKSNPEFQEDMLSTIENSVERMKNLLSQLRGGSRESGKSRIGLATLLDAVLQDKSAFKPRPVLNLPDRDVFVLADREKLGRVIGHVVQNACEATHHEGKVEIRLTSRDNLAIVEVEDNGRGMDEAFVRERLFKPFDSTKKSGMGIGAHECREYMRELGGEVEVSSKIGEGTLFRMLIPGRTDSEINP